MMEGISAYTIVQAERMMGEEALSVFLRSFSCPKNAEVEGFLKEKARQSSRLSSSMTYLVWSDRHKELLGYFTLAAKAYSVARSALNSKNRRLVERFAEVDEHGFFTAAVYLIAQIGKTSPSRRNGKSVARTCLNWRSTVSAGPRKPSAENW